MKVLTSKLFDNSLHSDSSPIALTSLSNIASNVKQNPLIKMEFLFDAKKAHAQTIIETTQLLQQQVLRPVYLVPMGWSNCSQPSQVLPRHHWEFLEEFLYFQGTYNEHHYSDRMFCYI